MGGGGGGGVRPSGSGAGPISTCNKRYTCARKPHHRYATFFNMYSFNIIQFTLRLTTFPSSNIRDFSVRPGSFLFLSFSSMHKGEFRLNVYAVWRHAPRRPVQLKVPTLRVHYDKCPYGAY